VLLRSRARSVLVAGLAVLPGLFLLADDPSGCPAIDPPAAVMKPAPGLRAFRDPVTGQLRQPTVEEAAAIARAQGEAAPERQPVFEIIVHPDGMKSVDLQDAFLSAAVATRNPDGSITVRCVPAGASTAAPAPLPVRQALEEK
jgi:hypothetical protein